jgi:simple sugar transport system permease protein/ribose transport system permease protein
VREGIIINIMNIGNVGKFAIKRKEFGVIVGTTLAFIVFSITTHGKWLSIVMMKTIMHTTSLLGIMAVGQSLLIVAGEFDLSVGSVFGLCGVTFITLVSKLEFGIGFAFIISMLVGVFAGFLNGLFTLKTHISSFIATLGGLFIYRGLVYYVTGGFTRALPKEARGDILIKILGGSFIYDFNNSIIWCILITLIFSIILSNTIYGNKVLCIGGDVKSSLSRGVDVTKTKWITFVITSSLAGFAGICSVSQMYIANTTLGNQMELESIASSVIGGCLLTGGIGSIWGSVMGSFLLSIIRSGLITVGAPPYWFITFAGIILIVGVILNTNISSWVKGRYNL